MARTATIRPDDVDLSTCDREPIHIPGSIQPFGVLLALDEPEGPVLQASENVGDLLGVRVEDVLGRTLDEVIGASPGEQLREAIAGRALDRNPLFLSMITVGREGRDRTFAAVAHRIDGLLILELETASPEGPVTFPGLYPSVQTFVANMGRAATVRELSGLAVEEVRRITGFDRVVVYRFDEDENGTVVAEARGGDALPSYLGHRFPASDIPRQARELYRRNRLRQIADADYTPVPLVPAQNPKTRRPLDLSFAALRSVSPIHVEYMKNMGTAASLSISILRDGLLWGLISCHHRTPRAVPFEVRAACDFLGQVLSVQLAAKEHQAEYEDRIRLKSLQARLLAFMANEEDFIDGLIGHPGELLEFASAGGAAVVVGGKCTRLGDAPDERDVLRLVDWLAGQADREVYSTDSLAEAIPGAESYKDRASGLLAIAISKLHRSYILWFRPEALRTVEWGGDPRKPFGDGDGRIHPRKSFAIWKETVRLCSLPWRQAEVDAAAELRNSIVSIVLRKAEELAELSAELTRANGELEAFSYSVSHDLRAPFRHIVGYSELLLEESQLSETGRRYVSTIIESAQYAGVLVDNLLAFSQMGRAAIHPVAVDMTQLFEDVRRDVMVDAAGRAIRWEIGDLPPAVCDPLMMRLAVRNLLANAVKYTRGRDEAVIQVGGEARPAEVVYSVRDNGTGFDMRYVDKLFGVFQRLHRMEDFEGTGIGLANVRRIVERHGGRTWAEGAVDSGATFSFSLPKPSETHEV